MCACVCVRVRRCSCSACCVRGSVVVATVGRQRVVRVKSARKELVGATDRDGVYDERR